jgi:hypothetical protein
LEILPPEVLLAAPGDSQPLTVVAHWPDGTSEDVTALCRFQSNNEAVATIDEAGCVTAAGRGDGDVVVFYDNGVVAVPVIVPVSDRTGDNYPDVAAPTEIDRLIVAKLKQLGVVPSPLCSDGEFLRRASIDITGTLPTPGEIEAFVADSSPDKRRRKIDELLDRPAYAAWWTNKLCDFTGCNPMQQPELGQDLAAKWYAWLYRRIAENAPYDQIVEGLVTADGRQAGEDYEAYAAQMSAYFRETSPDDFTERETMPYFWSRRTLEQPRDKALAFAHAFLGVRLDCAECHKHPYDRWTQREFQEVTNLFGGLKYGVAPESREAYRRIAQAAGAQVDVNKGTSIRDDLLVKAETGATIPWRELYWDGSRGGAKRVLGFELETSGGDPRGELMHWLRDPHNPWFARVFVNRVWANYFHRGLVEPTDDLNAANPPVNVPLLDYLAKGFVVNGFDMKWLHREIVRSDAYQRTWRPNETNAGDRRNFSRAVPRRLPAEVLYDALKQATAAEADTAEVIENLDRRAIGHLSMRMAGTYAMRVFGKPDRATNCDCERNDDPSLLQAVFVQNDPLVQSRLAESGWLAEIEAMSSPDVPALVREAYLRTVGRTPDDAELARTVEHVRGAESVRAGMADLMWALLNTKEFLLNH